MPNPLLHEMLKDIPIMTKGAVTRNSSKLFEFYIGIQDRLFILGVLSRVGGVYLLAKIVLRTGQLGNLDVCYFTIMQVLDDLVLNHSDTWELYGEEVLISRALEDNALCQSYY